MNRAIVAGTLIALASGSAFAQSVDENDEGLYIGGSVGQFNLDIDGIDGLDEAVEQLDDNDTAWQAFVGWRLNPYISLQAAYVDFGRPEDRATISGSSGNYRAELDGFAPAVIGTLPLGPVELSAKLGYLIYDLKIHANIDDLGGDIFQSDDSGEDLTYGVGVGITLFERLQAKLEYEEIDLERVDNANAFWLTGQWRF